MTITKLTSDESKLIRTALRKYGVSKAVKLSANKWHVYVGGQSSGWMTLEDRVKIANVGAALGFVAQAGLMDDDLVDTVVFSKIG